MPEPTNGASVPSEKGQVSSAPVAWRQVVDHDRHSDEPCARACAEEHWCYEGSDAFRAGYDPAAHGWQPLYSVPVETTPDSSSSRSGDREPLRLAIENYPPDGAVCRVCGATFRYGQRDTCRADYPHDYAPSASSDPAVSS